MADLSAQQRREVSAESFRRLTALLKKPAIASIIVPKIEVPATSLVATPAIVAEAFENAVAAEPVQTPKILAQSVEVVELTSAGAHGEYTANSAQVLTQEIIENPEIAIAAEPVPVRKPVVRQRPRDAFAVSP